MTLSDLAYYVRKFGPFAVIGFILFIVFYALIQMALTSYQNRPVEQVYTPPFGNLEPIEFTHSVDYPPNFTLEIDNIEGRPIIASDSAQIYPIPSSRTRFGYQQALAFMARAVGIDTEQEWYELNDLTATFDDGLRELVVDITTYNFTFEVDFQRTPDIFEEAYIPENPNLIVEEARSHLRQMSKYPEALAQGRTNIVYMNYDPAVNELTVVDNPQEANVVEVDFFAPDVSELPVVSPKFYNSSNFVLLLFRESGNLVLKSQVSFFPKDFTAGGPYPLKSGDQAWQELLNRQGTIISPATGTTDIVVKRMFLAYYEPSVYQPYFMPVFVFVGENGFVGYVSAVQEQYIRTSDDSAPQDGSGDSAAQENPEIEDDADS